MRYIDDKLQTGLIEWFRQARKKKTEDINSQGRWSYPSRITQNPTWPDLGAFLGWLLNPTLSFVFCRSLPIIANCLIIVNN